MFLTLFLIFDIVLAIAVLAKILFTVQLRSETLPVCGSDALREAVRRLSIQTKDAAIARKSVWFSSTARRLRRHFAAVKTKETLDVFDGVLFDNAQCVAKTLKILQRALSLPRLLPYFGGVPRVYLLAATLVKSLPLMEEAMTKRLLTLYGRTSPLTSAEEKTMPYFLSLCKLELLAEYIEKRESLTQDYAVNNLAAAAEYLILTSDLDESKEFFIADSQTVFRQTDERRSDGGVVAASAAESDAGKTPIPAIDAPAEVSQQTDAERTDAPGYVVKTAEQIAESVSRYALRPSCAAAAYTDDTLGCLYGAGIDPTLPLILFVSDNDTPRRNILEFLAVSKLLGERFSTPHTAVLLSTEELLRSSGAEELPDFARRIDRAENPRLSDAVAAVAVFRFEGALNACVNPAFCPVASTAVRANCLTVTTRHVIAKDKFFQAALPLTIAGGESVATVAHALKEPQVVTDSFFVFAKGVSAWKIGVENPDRTPRSVSVTVTLDAAFLTEIYQKTTGGTPEKTDAAPPKILGISNGKRTKIFTEGGALFLETMAQGVVKRCTLVRGAEGGLAVRLTLRVRAEARSAVTFYMTISAHRAVLSQDTLETAIINARTAMERLSPLAISECEDTALKSISGALNRQIVRKKLSLSVFFRGRIRPIDLYDAVLASSGDTEFLRGLLLNAGKAVLTYGAETAHACEFASMLALGDICAVRQNNFALVKKMLPTVESVLDSVDRDGIFCLSGDFMSDAAATLLLIRALDQMIPSCPSEQRFEYKNALCALKDSAREWFCELALYKSYDLLLLAGMAKIDTISASIQICDILDGMTRVSDGQDKVKRCCILFLFGRARAGMRLFDTIDPDSIEKLSSFDAATLYNVLTQNILGIEQIAGRLRLSPCPSVRGFCAKVKSTGILVRCVKLGLSRPRIRVGERVYYTDCVSMVNPASDRFVVEY